MARSPSPAARRREARDLLAALGQAMHEAGAAAHRIEDAVARAGAGLDVSVTVFSTPTALIVSFGSDDNRVLRVVPCEVDLERLAALEALVEQLCTAPAVASPARWTRRLRRLARCAPAYGKVSTHAAFALVPGAVAVAFGGGLAEATGAAVVGLLAGHFERRFVAWPHLRRSWFLLAALLTTLGAGWLSTVLGIAPDIVVLAGLIVLFPGYTLTTAVAELATGNLAAGSSRFTAAALVLLQLGVGATVAGRLVPWPATAAEVVAPDLWTQGVALLVGGLGLSVLLSVPRRWVWAALLTSAASFVGTVAAKAHLGPDLGVLGGAFLATLLSNIIARTVAVPAVVPLVPAIILLVPGSMGYRSMLALGQQQTLVGLQSAVSMCFTAVAIVAGMLLAHAVISPRRLRQTHHRPPMLPM